MLQLFASNRMATYILRTNSPSKHRPLLMHSSCAQASETAELVEKLEDSQMTLGSMASNRYSAPFREDVTGWITKLSTVSEIVEQWLMVQSMWMYMEAVFSGGDIVKQLPQEAKRFQNIDKSFTKVCFHQCLPCMHYACIHSWRLQTQLLGISSRADQLCRSHFHCALYPLYCIIATHDPKK